MARAALLAVAGLALLLGASAAGMPSWTPPARISSGERSLGPDLALNGNGEGLVVWDQEVGSECATAPGSLFCIHIVEVAARASRSATWQEPSEVSRPGVGSTPRVAIDPSGDGAILWVHDIGRDRVLQATYRRGSSGTFPEPNDLSEPALEITSHRIALDAAGDAVAVWRQGSDVEAAVRPAASGAWSSPVLLSSAARRTASGPELALTPGGQAAVAWIDEAGEVWVAAGDAQTGIWGASTALAGAPRAGTRGPAVALSSAGDTAVVWGDDGTNGVRATVRAVVKPRNGTWIPPLDIGVARMEAADELQLAVDDSGKVIAVFGDADGLRAAVREPTGAWLSERISAPGTTISTPRLALDAIGNAVVVWTSGEAGILHAATRPSALGTWLPPVLLSGSEAWAPDLAIDAAGRAVAVWNRRTAERVVVESADLAGSGPYLEGLTAPRRPIVVGARARFSVRPVPWAAPLAGAPSWRFGDGNSGRGARVVHTYRRSGSFLVTVSQEDAAGGASSSSTSVTVVAARLRNRRPPSIRGTPRVGSTLTCARGLWSGSPPIRYAYGWRRDGRLVAAATGRRYRLRQRDAGSLLACQVQATSPGGSLARSSEAVLVRG